MSQIKKNIRINSNREVANKDIRAIKRITIKKQISRPIENILKIKTNLKIEVETKTLKITLIIARVMRNKNRKTEMLLRINRENLEEKKPKIMIRENLKIEMIQKTIAILRTMRITEITKNLKIEIKIKITLHKEVIQMNQIKGNTMETIFETEEKTIAILRTMRITEITKNLKIEIKIKITLHKEVIQMNQIKGNTMETIFETEDKVRMIGSLTPEEILKNLKIEKIIEITLRKKVTQINQIKGNTMVTIFPIGETARMIENLTLEKIPKNLKTEIKITMTLRKKVIQINQIKGNTMVTIFPTMEKARIIENLTLERIPKTIKKIPNKNRQKMEEPRPIENTLKIMIKIQIEEKLKMEGNQLLEILKTTTRTPNNRKIRMIESLITESRKIITTTLRKMILKMEEKQITETPRTKIILRKVKLKMEASPKESKIKITINHQRKTITKTIDLNNCSYFPIIH